MRPVSYETRLFGDPFLERLGLFLTGNVFRATRPVVAYGNRFLILFRSVHIHQKQEICYLYDQPSRKSLHTSSILYC